jgi:mRNA interferase RelE/StbE
MNIFYSKSSLKYLLKLGKKKRVNIVSAIDQLPENGDVKKMHGVSIKDLYRLRIGEYRILFTWKGPDIRILDVDTRGDIYK